MEQKCVKVRRESRSYNLQSVFDFIVDFKKSHDGNSPSLTEIMAALDISSKGIARGLLIRLEKSGRIRRSSDMGTARFITVVGGEWTLRAAKE